MDGEFRTKAEEKAHLAKIIQEWNDSRLDMFALSMPDKVCIGKMSILILQSSMKRTEHSIRLFVTI